MVTTAPTSPNRAGRPLAGALIAGIGISMAGAGLALSAAGPAHAAPGDRVCAGAHQSPPGETSSWQITAPDGMLISSYCVKAGSSEQGEGPVYVNPEPDVKSVVISHPSGKAISHYSVWYVPESQPVTEAPPVEPEGPQTEPEGPHTSEPPTSEPPTSEPPTSEPPTSEPPTSEPPTTRPPSVKPSKETRKPPHRGRHHRPHHRPRAVPTRIAAGIAGTSATPQTAAADVDSTRTDLAHGLAGLGAGLTVAGALIGLARRRDPNEA